MFWIWVVIFVVSVYADQLIDFLHFSEACRKFLFIYDDRLASNSYLAEFYLLIGVEGAHFDKMVITGAKFFHLKLQILVIFATNARSNFTLAWIWWIVLRFRTFLRASSLGRHQIIRIIRLTTAIVHWISLKCVRSLIFSWQMIRLDCYFNISCPLASIDLITWNDNSLCLLQWLHVFAMSEAHWFFILISYWFLVQRAERALVRIIHFFAERGEADWLVMLEATFGLSKGVLFCLGVQRCDGLK